MAFLSMPTMEGGPGDLLTRKRQRMGPVVQRLAPGMGAVWSVTAKTGMGTITVSMWSAPEGAARFSQDPEAHQARQASGLPRPASFGRIADADYAIYQPQ